MKKKFDINILFLVTIGTIPLLALLHPGIFQSHDVEAHLGRLANFYTSLSEGNLIPRWGANLNYGYGHPVLMFLFPLPMYAGSLLHLLGLSFIDSLKAIFALSFLGSGVTMYFFIKETWGEKPGFLAGVFYMFAPYRFVDIYVRGAIGESLAFLFPPIVCLFVIKLKANLKWQYVVGGGITLAFLILSHNALGPIFLLFTLGLMAVCFFEKKEDKQKMPIYYLSLITLGLALSAFFWMPSFFEGKYTLRDVVIDKKAVFENFANTSQLLIPSWGYNDPRTKGGFSLQIGILQILVTISAIILSFKRRKEKTLDNLGMLTLVSLGATLFLLTSFSRPVWEVVPVLQKFQFPWRFLSLVVFTTAITSGFLVFSLKTEKSKIIAVFLLIILVVLENKNYWHPNGYFFKNDNYFLNEYSGTTDTGESAPRWSIRGMEEKAKSNVEVIGGEGRVAEIKRNGTEHRYKILAKGPVQLRDNTLYFPGWGVKVDGKETDIEYHDPNNRGVITFNVPDGQHDVKVVFKETKLRLFSDIISLVGVVAVLTSLVFLLAKKKVQT